MWGVHWQGWEGVGNAATATHVAVFQSGMSSAQNLVSYHFSRSGIWIRS